MNKSIAGAATVLLVAGFTFTSVLPCSAQYRYHQARTLHRSGTFLAQRSDSYLSQNGDLMSRIDSAQRSGQISNTDAISLRDAVNQQAQAYYTMRNSDGYLSSDELTSLNTLLNRTSSALDILSTAQTGRFSTRQNFYR